MRIVAAAILFSVAGSVQSHAAALTLGKVGSSPVIVDTVGSPLTRSTSERLAAYIASCLGVRPEITRRLARPGRTSIVLGYSAMAPRLGVPAAPEGQEAFSIATTDAPSSMAVVLGNTDKGIRRGVQKLILLTRQEPQNLVLPDTRMSERPWKSSRVYMLVNWRPDDVRTKFSNRLVDKRVDPFRYSEEQLRAYVAMFDDLGFNGVQLGESSISWAMTGSKEAYQEILRKVAQSAHALGQQVSYLMWAAEFNVGWIDREIVYEPAPGQSAFSDPAVRRGFEKYYDHYSRMAPYVDLVIGHWFDAGRLKSLDDVIEYQKLLRQKMLARNPKLKFGVNTWGHPGFMQALIKAKMNDFLLLEMSMPNVVPMEKRREFRRMAADNGFSVGMWGWYMTEYESDQAPNMHVSGHVLKEYINNIRHGAEPVLPTAFWSEMEAYHINNVYTMAQAAQLLWNPDRDPDDILREVADAIWGPDAGAVYDALKLIEDTRSGPNWETFSYRSPKRRDGTEDPVDDARRAREALSRLATLKPDPAYVPKMELPVSRETLLELMLPHLQQVRLFAEFRTRFEDVRRLKSAGADKSTLSAKVAEIWRPIPEFDTWIGTYGQAEAWRQEQMIRKFCEEVGIQAPTPNWKMDRDRQRALEKIQSEQRVKAEPHEFGSQAIAGEFSLDRNYARELIEGLVSEGWLERVAQDKYRLVHWSDIAFPVRARMGLLDY